MREASFERALEIRARLHDIQRARDHWQDGPTLTTLVKLVAPAAKEGYVLHPKAVLQIPAVAAFQTEVVANLAREEAALHREFEAL